MSWYVRKTTEPSTLDHTIYYSFEKKETPNQTNKKSTTQEKSQTDNQKQEKPKQPIKRKQISPTDSAKSTKKKKTTAITEAFI